MRGPTDAHAARVAALRPDCHRAAPSSRRHLIAGAVGVGALAAIGGGVYVATHQNDSDDIDVLEVPESAVSSSNDLGDSSPAEEHMRLAGNFELPYGTLVFSSSDRLACSPAKLPIHCARLACCGWAPAISPLS